MRTSLTKYWPPSYKVAIFVLIVGCLVLFVRRQFNTLPSDAILREAKGALLKKDFAACESLAVSIPQDAPERLAALLLAGEAATRTGRLPEALEYYSELMQADATSADGQLAMFSSAEIHLELGQLTEAEQLYRLVLDVQPNNALTNARMAFLLSITNRRWEALDHYFVLIKSGDADYRELAISADVGRMIEQPEFIAKCTSRSPDDPLVQLAVANQAFGNGDVNALGLLTALLESNPKLLPAQALAGELIVNTGDDATFLRWHQSLPDNCDQSPDIWFVRGLWARKHSDHVAAVDCFLNTVRKTPFHRRAFYMLSQVLLAIDSPHAEETADYSKLLIELSQTIDQVLKSSGKSEESLRKATMLLEKLGRTWEACAWAVASRNSFPDAAWPSEVFARHRGKLNTELARVEPEKNPVSAMSPVNSTSFHELIESVAAHNIDSHNGTRNTAQPTDRIRFEESGVIPFVYHNSDDPATLGVRSFEQTGGGVAVIDFDLDLLPDVFLPQGCDWHTGDNVPSPSDRFHDGLFRNFSGESFRDASTNLGSSDNGFGQGCSVGDFDNDGFPDLYVANVGRNCLYRNMGDGTFVDVTTAAAITDESWSASVVLCDLNADGLPDIFDVNYLSGEGVYEKICMDRACSPSVFSGAPDVLLINQGDGTFERLAEATPAEQSKGLGIVVFESEYDRRPTLFIANDQVANFLLMNEPASTPGNIVLTNNAVLNGLAYNDNGLPMACMGVAIDDLDGNDLLDIFTTNFQDESNTVYLQDSPGLFTDATRAVGLQAVSVPFTGWGTQTLDADLDGWPDLVVTNGHVDDGRDYGGDYHQRPQFFHNVGGSFLEADPEEIGPWFSQLYLGRGLARVDWNVDGLPDFIVSNINAPVSVLRNVSSNTGHFLRIRLHATESARDAIGARVTVSYANHRVTRQLLAGDGYMACNERVVTFGLGSVAAVEEVVVRWPSGATSVLTSPPVDSTLIVVEGKSSVTRSADSQFTSFPVSAITGSSM